MADAFDQDLSHAYAPPSQTASSDAFDQDLTHAYSGGEASAPSSSQGAEWSDYYKSGKAAVQEMAARAMTGAQRFADAYGTQAASEANRRSAVDLARDAEATRQSMSEGGRQIAEAQAIPTNGGPGLIESAWNHPVDTIGVKGAQVIGGVAPYLVAGAVGGLPAEVAVGAADQASSSMQAAVGQSNAMTDAELAQASPRFAQLLRETPDPYAARVKFRDELYTTPQLAADLVGGGAIGWITGRTLGSGKAALSGAEKVAEVGGGAAERSALRTMTEQGVGNAAGAVSTDYAQQRSEAVSKGQAAGFTPNVSQMLVAGVNAGVEGALAAGAPHAYAGARDRVKTWLGSEPRPPAPVVPEVGGDAAQNAALQAAQQGVTPPIQPTQRQPAPRAPAPQGEISPTASPVTPAANPAPAASTSAPTTAQGEISPTAPSAQQQALDAAAARLNAQNETPAGPVDAGMNVPERPETLAAQEQAQAEGRKDVVAYPGGKGVPRKLPDGMSKVPVDGIIYIYRQKSKDAPDGFTAKQIKAAHADGSIAGLLNPAHAVQPKSEVAARVAQGEPAAAVVTQKLDGTEVEASASTPDMVPAKMAAMEATKAPDETVVVKPVDQVVTERQTSEAPLAEVPPVETPNAVTSTAKTPERPVSEGASRKAAEDLGAVAEKPAAPTEIKLPPGAKGKAAAKTSKSRKPVGTSEPAATRSRLGKHYDEAQLKANEQAVEIVRDAAISQDDLAKAAGGDAEARKSITEKMKAALTEFGRRAKEFNDTLLQRHPSKADDFAKWQAARAAYDANPAAWKAANPDKSVPRKNYAGHMGIPEKIMGANKEEFSSNGALRILSDFRRWTKTGKITPKAWEEIPARYAELMGSDITKLDKDLQSRFSSEGDLAKKPPAPVTEEGDNIIDNIGNDALGPEAEASRAKIEGILNDYAEGRISKEEALKAADISESELPAPRKEKPVAAPREKTAEELDLEKKVDARRAEKAAEEAEKAKGRSVETDKERIAREALERAAKKEAAAPPPPPEPKPTPKPKPAEDMAAVWLRQQGEKVADEPLPIRSLDADLTGTVQEQLDHAMSGGTFARLPSGRSVAVTRTAKARNLIKPSDFGRMWTSDPKDRVFMPMVIRRMLQVAGDTPVSILKDNEMNRRAMENWTKADAMGAYDPRSDRVYMMDADDEVARHVLVHEVTHAATAAGIESSPKLKADIRKLMDHILDQVGDQGWFERPGLNDIKTIRDHYAFKNEKEFIAEFGGNKIFHETIRDVQVSPELARELGMKNWQRQTVYNAIIDRLRRFFRLPEKAHSALEAALMMTDRAMTETERARGEGRARTGEALPLPRVDDARRAAEDMRLGERMREQTGRLKRYMAFTNDIARKLDDLMGGGVRWARDAASMLESKHARFNRFLKQYGGEDAVATASRLQREHGEDYRRLVDLTYDARHAGVDIEHGPEQFSDAINSVKGKAWLEKHGDEIARLRDEQPELWSGMKQVRDTIDRYHTESAVGALKSVLEYFKMEGVDTEGLARRFYHDALTERDKALLDITDETKAEQKEISELLNAMHGLRVKYRKEAGTYTPFFREGTHWISAKRAVNYVGSGELTSANEVHFEQQEGETKAQLRERVKDFARTAVKEHDYDLGDIYSGVLDPENPHGALLEPEQEGPLVYRVPLKLDYAAKVDGEVAGRQRLEELKADNTYRVGDRTYYRYEGFTAPRVQSSSDFTSPGSGALSPRLDALRARLQKQDAFKMKDPAEQEAILKSLEEAALIGRAGTSSLSPNLLRARKVRGYDTDYTRAVASYVSRAASDMAKAEVMPQVEDALYKINQQIGYRKDDTQGHTDRAAYYEEFKNRLLHSTEMSKTAKNPVVRRLLQMTALDKLFGVSFHVVNATEAPILSGAALGGRHGFTRTYASMGAIYRMMGVGDLLKSGAKNTLGARDVYAKASDYPGMVREALSRTEEGRDLIPALDHMVNQGLMSPEAEYFFYQESAPKEGRIGKAMSTADRMARQMTQVVETINRTVTGLAAYKMERARLIAEGKTETAAQKAALDYAHDTVKEVMGDYSNTNSGRIFDEQYLGAAMQFKKYAVKTYTLMGRMVGNAWKGDKEAQRSFLGLMVLQGVAAGAMGLPFMEVAKQAYSAYNFAAGNEYDVDSAFEYGLRSLAKTLGFTGAAQDAAVHGVTRAIPGVGIDLGSRVGMDKLTGVALPKSTRKNDMLEWFGATLTGASESTIQELLDGLGKLRDDALKGPTKATDVVAHVGNVLPVKVAADITKAAAGYFGQPETARGYKRSDPYTPAEAVLKAMGLRSAREARESELRNVDYVQTQIQQHQRTDFERRWNLATTGDERARLWGEIERWNAGIADPTARLRRADLNAYVADFKKKSMETVLGQEVHKRDRWIVNRNKQLFGAP